MITEPPRSTRQAPASQLIKTRREEKEEMIIPGREYKGLISEAATPWLSIHRGVRTCPLLMGAR